MLILSYDVAYCSFSSVCLLLACLCSDHIISKLDKGYDLSNKKHLRLCVRAVSICHRPLLCD